MASLLCKCGKKLSTVSVPNDVKIWVYTSDEWSDIKRTRKYIDDMPLPKYDVWNCSECKRIHVFDGATKIAVYRILNNSDLFDIENADEFKALTNRDKSDEENIIAYTDYEMDKVTNGISLIEQLPLPKNIVSISSDCSRLYVDKPDSTKIIFAKE